MSYVKIWVHLVFCTKNREPWLRKEIRRDIYHHIIQNCKEKEIFLQAINGYTEHIHCLISLGKDQNISKVAQLIKGESSFWINKTNLVPGKFSWQDDYWAVSIGESQVDRVVAYIKNQEAHHSKNLSRKKQKSLCRNTGGKLSCSKSEITHLLNHPFRISYFSQAFVFRTQFNTVHSHSGNPCF